MKRELYIYWHVGADQAATAAAAVAVWQADLCRRHPGLQARLLRRHDGEVDFPARCTLMETYCRAGGIGPALHTEIVEQGAQAAAPWCQGPRHVEVFEPLDG